MPGKATEAYYQNASPFGFDSQRDAYEQGYEDGAEAERKDICESAIDFDSDYVLVRRSDLA